jgi:carboxynorspermidine decarboxylase
MRVGLSAVIQGGSIPEQHDRRDWVEKLPASPAFVFDEQRLAHNLALLDGIRSNSGCRILYSIKACPFTGLLKRMCGLLDGFSVSSLFEARLAREALAGAGSLHITSPGLRRNEMAEIGDLCDAVSFNSLSQLERLPCLLGGRAKVGLRINPQLSFLQDPRYDPCRRHSKLGAPLAQVVEHWRAGGLSASGLSGLHLHSNFASNSFTPLQTTVAHLEAHLPQLVRDIEWVNLGGGYLFQASSDPETLLATIDHIQTTWNAQVYLEPGKSVVDDTGFLLASVIDLFESDGKSIAVLDTSVNHLPEVFEYQSRPQLLNEPTDAPYSTLLAGSTCLSGDLFGEYRFSRPLEINDRLVFENVGAYSLIKASRFNGHNLPSIYLLGNNGAPTLMKAYDYDDYRRQWIDAETARQISKTGTG